MATNPGSSPAGEFKPADLYAKIQRAFTTNDKTRRPLVSDGGTAGLSSPSQLVEMAASVSVSTDKTASGASLLILTSGERQSQSGHLSNHPPHILCVSDHHMDESGDLEREHCHRRM